MRVKECRVHFPRIGRARIISILFGLTVCILPPAFAREKTDVIVMKNGDRITGEVKRLENGILKVDLDYVDGTLSISWLKVDRMESKALFLVQLENGDMFSGKVITSQGLTPSSIEIQPEGEQPFKVDESRVVRMTQTSESVLHRFSANVTLGATYSKGNNATQYNIGSAVDYTDTRWGTDLNQSSNLASNTGAPTTTRNQVDLTAYHLSRWPNYFYEGTAGFLQSSVQGINQQTTLGMGVGRFLKNSNMIRFTILGGLGWQRTYYVPEVATQQLQDTAVGLISSNLEAFRFKKTRLKVYGTLAPALSQRGRLFSRVNATYYLSVFGKVDWNFSFYGSWDTQPPSHLPSSDYGTSTGLSYTFGNR